MPFLSPDWRSPGEKWVRYEGGWKMKKTVWATQCFRSVPSTTSLVSVSSDDSGCEAGSDSEVQAASSPTNSVGGGGGRNGANVRFSFEEEEEEEEAEAEVETRSVKARAKSLINRLSGGGGGGKVVTGAGTGGRCVVGVSLNASHTLPCDLRRRALEKSSVAASSLPEGYAAQTEQRRASYRTAPAELLFDRSDRLRQPYFHITLKSTKEVAGFNALADALLRLDFVNGVRDIRKFAYISKIVYMLFSHDRLNQLPGAAQKVLFRILEEMAVTVYRNNRTNEHVLRKLLDELHATMTVYHVWGAHLGSSCLFRQHLESRRRIIEIVERMQVQYKQDLAIPSRSNESGLMGKLPEECIREILLKLSDPRDVESAGDTCAVMGAIARERRVWRELAQTHFTPQQIDAVLRERPELISPGGGEQKEWKHLYKCLRWRYGLREDYAEVLLLCRKCRVLFWQSIGHPCVAPENESGGGGGGGGSGSGSGSGGEHHVTVTPQTFLTFFSV